MLCPAVALIFNPRFCLHIKQQLNNSCVFSMGNVFQRYNIPRVIVNVSQVYNIYKYLKYNRDRIKNIFDFFHDFVTVS